MVFVEIASLKSELKEGKIKPGDRFMMTSVEHVDRNGNLKPGKNASPFEIIFERVLPSGDGIQYTIPSSEDPEKTHEAGRNKVVEKISGGGRRRGRTLRRRRAGKTRRGRKH